jgi:hypothetical protein
LAEACAALTPPYAVKLVSPTITHKSDLGGVVLGLPDVEAATEAAQAIRERIRAAMPDAAIAGFEVSEMADTAQCRELLVGVADDAQFGPVIAVGAGGVDVELIGLSAHYATFRMRSVNIPMSADTTRSENGRASLEIEKCSSFRCMPQQRPGSPSAGSA